MNVVKCKNGHFFDGDTYATCPHCGESVGSGSAQAGSSPDPEKKKFSWGKKGKTAAEPQEKVTTFGRSTHASPEQDPLGKAETDVIFREDPQKTPENKVEKKKEHTLDFWQTTPEPELNYGGRDREKEDPVCRETEPAGETAPENKVTPADNRTEEKSHNADSLRVAVQKASANSEGKTLSYFSAATAATAQGEVRETAADPVVGWLVCIGGKHFGESFNISAGKNSVGRSSENKIVLNKDNKISRIKHALITYEPKKRNFYLQPGDSSGLTYLNDDYIDESKILRARDLIEIGDSKFLFVPLCGKDFSWEDLLQKE